MNTGNFLGISQDYGLRDAFLRFQRWDACHTRTSPEGTAEGWRDPVCVQPSLRDSNPSDVLPGVETPYSRVVPPGQWFAIRPGNFRKAFRLKAKDLAVPQIAHLRRHETGHGTIHSFGALDWQNEQLDTRDWKVSKTRRQECLRYITASGLSQHLAIRQSRAVNPLAHVREADISNEGPPTHSFGSSQQTTEGLKASQWSEAAPL